MFYLFFAALVAAADQFVKLQATRALPNEFDRMALLPGFVRLERIHNEAASFGFLPGMRWPLVAVMLACSVGIVIFLFRTEMESRLGKAAIAAVLGGAVGNVIDRITLGHVIDMFRFELRIPIFNERFPVFNVADCFIVIGGIVFCICYFNHMLETEKQWKGSAPQTKPRGRMPELGRLRRANEDGAEDDRC